MTLFPVFAGGDGFCGLSAGGYQLHAVVKQHGYISVGAGERIDFFVEAALEKEL